MAGRGRAPRRAPSGEGLVSGCDGVSDGVKFQQVRCVSCHSCVRDLG